MSVAIITSLLLCAAAFGAWAAIGRITCNDAPCAAANAFLGAWSAWLVFCAVWLTVGAP